MDEKLLDSQVLAAVEEYALHYKVMACDPGLADTAA